MTGLKLKMLWLFYGKWNRLIHIGLSVLQIDLSTKDSGVKNSSSKSKGLKY